MCSNPSHNIGSNNESTYLEVVGEVGFTERFIPSFVEITFAREDDSVVDVSLLIGDN